MKVLVAYETAHKSTAEVAEAIATTLREGGDEADVARCRELQSAEGYDACIIGSPVWAGNWLKPARAFVARNEQALAARPVAYFHMSGAAGIADERPEIVRIMNESLPEYAPSVKPVSIGAFGGVIDYDRYNFVLRMVMKSVVGRGGGPTSGRHDLRDWDEIREWTMEVQRLFREHD